MLRREAFTAVGGFDEWYFMYFEDIDLGARLDAAGWHSVYAPTATVDHPGGHVTFAATSTKMSKAHHDSAYRYLSSSLRRSGVGSGTRCHTGPGSLGRYQLSRRVRRVVHGAQPTRKA